MSTPGSANLTESFSKWAEEIWEIALKSWIGRTGQDHFYRDRVVIPMLLSWLQQIKPITLADLGCGDGHTTAALVHGLKQNDTQPKRIMLVERSKEQLEKAMRRKDLRSAVGVRDDLLNGRWEFALRHSPVPKALISVFVLGELPDTVTFFHKVADAMGNFDRLITVNVHPKYAELLRNQGKIVGVQEISNGPFRWAGKYPIPIQGGKVIYLPHFQRSIEDYEEAAKSAGLNTIQSCGMLVPDTPEARSVFEPTVYGSEIIGMPSSLLMVFSKV